MCHGHTYRIDQNGTVAEERDKTDSEDDWHSGSEDVNAFIEGENDEDFEL